VQNCGFLILMAVRAVLVVILMAVRAVLAAAVLVAAVLWSSYSRKLYRSITAI
jgi:hypothetical protein